jgi:hypothetical protein
MVDRALVIAIDHPLLEAERPREPLEGSVRVGEAHEREDVRRLIGHLILLALGFGMRAFAAG